MKLILSTAALLLIIVPCGSQSRLEPVVGSVVFVDDVRKEFVENAPNVFIELQSGKKIIKLKSNQAGILNELLPLGKYCLKAAYTADNKPLPFSAAQYRCFRIRSKRAARFDVMLLTQK
jgi:uncharacterized protein YlzI (FlbEa/FlbD family)